MMKIIFVTPGKANLPEIKAYSKYFSLHGDEVFVVNREDIEKYKNAHFDIEWHFMGFSRKKLTNSRLVIHEYASLSTPPFSKFKNTIKGIFSHTPDLRIFLNHKVKDDLTFLCDSKYLIRDMGVELPKQGFRINTDSKYDFLYVGAMDPSRDIDGLIKLFIDPSYNPNGLKLFLLGKAQDDLLERYKVHSNIVFLGFVPQEEVFSYILDSEVCVNWIPNVYPYNIQTSTKLLEYAAMGKKVITTRYNWVDEFSERNSYPLFFFSDEDGLSKSFFSKDRNIPSVASWSKIFQELKLRDYIFNLLKE
ncbi:glycosyltransferase [Vibrio harveyi]|uniref:glycosyltransferase n=1 Tax=Vibrio harveyi TaxID=669 RepID=UPI0024B73051|nr:glycosyltransferase [Vibrio harveyi]WHP62507.1 glycosyltransferase [Vibrio harveyi]